VNDPKEHAPGLFSPLLLLFFVDTHAPRYLRPIPCIVRSNESKQRTGEGKRRRERRPLKKKTQDLEMISHLEPALKTSTITVAFLPTTGGRGSTNCYRSG